MAQIDGLDDVVKGTLRGAKSARSSCSVLVGASTLGPNGGTRLRAVLKTRGLGTPATRSMGGCLFAAFSSTGRPRFSERESDAWRRRIRSTPIDLWVMRGNPLATGANPPQRNPRKTEPSAPRLLALLGAAWGRYSERSRRVARQLPHGSLHGRRVYCATRMHPGEADGPNRGSWFEFFRLPSVIFLPGGATNAIS